MAARAAAAAGAARLGSAKPAAAAPSAAPADAWADGSPTEEAPYDPEYDGPPRGGSAPSANVPTPARVPGAATMPGSANLPASASFEGFDPGDEPLDDVIDEKTARMSSEQKAMQLLQDAFGAEKISES